MSDERLRQLYNTLPSTENLSFLSDPRHLEMIYFSQTTELGIDWGLVTAPMGAVGALVYGGTPPAMRATVEALKLPRSLPSNIGELAFQVFKRQLQSGNPPDEAVISHPLPQGKEHELRLLLAKIERVYSGGAINEEFFTTLRS